MNLQKAPSGNMDYMIGGILQFIFFFSLSCLFQGFGIFNNHVYVSYQSPHPSQQRMELPLIPPRVFQMPAQACSTSAPPFSLPYGNIWMMLRKNVLFVTLNVDTHE